MQLTRMTTARFGKALVACSLAAVGIGGSLASTVTAGELTTAGSIRLSIYVAAADASAVFDGLTLELQNTNGTDIIPTMCTLAATDQRFGLEYVATYDCPQALYGDYQFVISGIPANRYSYTNCNTQDPSLLVHLSSSSSCYLSIYGPLLYLDKSILDPSGHGTAEVSDFQLEVFPSTGEVYDSSADPSPDLCVQAGLAFDPAVCAVIDLEPGNWQLGEIPVPGYDAFDAYCGAPFGDFFDERIAREGSTFSIAAQYESVYCRVINQFTGGSLKVTTSVTNDGGGTATPTAVSVEVYDATSMLVVPATPCLSDGTCLDISLPIGDYVIGYVGPTGYTRTVTQTVTAPPVIDGEQIVDDADASFTLGAGDLVEIAVVIDDPTPTTTTTSTTTTTTTTTTVPPTTTAPTTAAPTTAAPTTVGIVTTSSIDAAGVTLPQTGTSSSTNRTVALLATSLIGFGGVMLTARRRSIR